jgi:hypothetical protein
MKPYDEFKQISLPCKKSTPIDKDSANNRTRVHQGNLAPKLTSLSAISANPYRKKWIAESAYFIALHRDFVPGYALDDWLQAEQLFKEMLVGKFLEFAWEDGEITLVGLKQLAQAVGVKNTDMLYSKIELIIAIQTACGSMPCFNALPLETCRSDSKCLWKNECKKLTAQWQR